MDNRLSRNDFNYTHGMTNIPAQVREMKEAGLNPALAYGQISAPQGQVLGNYQSDILQGANAYARMQEAKANAEYRKAETDVLKAQAAYIIQKTKAEAGMATFDWAHQGDRYNLEIEGKGLVNAGQRVLNRGYQLDNKNKMIQNEILGIQKDIENFNRTMKEIDASKHSDYVDAEIRRLVSSTHLAFKEAWALDQKVPKEVEQLNALTNKVKVEITEMRKNGTVNREHIRKLSAFQQLENEYLEWLGKDPRVRSMIENHKSEFSDILISLFVTPSY